jgi:hypothetical protein
VTFLTKKQPGRAAGLFVCLDNPRKDCDFTCRGP